MAVLAAVVSSCWLTACHHTPCDTSTATMAQTSSAPPSAPSEGQQAPLPDAQDTPVLEFVCQLDVTTGQPYAVGNTTKGYRNIVPITGGSFEGPRLRGTILPGGADYQLTDAVMHHTELEAIYDIRTDDGCVIHVRNAGLIAEGYFRAEPRFEAPADSPYAWMNDALYVCAPAPTAAGASISLGVWMVK